MGNRSNDLGREGVHLLLGGSLRGFGGIETIYVTPSFNKRQCK